MGIKQSKVEGPSTPKPATPPKRRILKTPSKHPRDGQQEKWHDKLKMSPPGVNKNGGRAFLDIDTVEERMIYDGYGNYVINDPDVDPTSKQKILYYLYGTEYMWSYDMMTPIAKEVQRERTKKIDMFLSKKSGARGRMEDILKNEEDRALTSIEAQQHWIKNQTFILRYRARYDTITIFDDCLVPYVARRQVSRTCFLVAVGTLLGYKYSLDNFDLLLDQDEALMAHSIDLSRLIRHHFHNEQLEKRVLGNEGGCSTEVLNSLISHIHGFKAMHCSIDDDEEDNFCIDIIKKALKKYGPILVPRFRTTDHFRQVRRQHFPLGTIPQFDVDPVTGKDIVQIYTLSKPAENENQILNTFAQANGFNRLGEDVPELLESLSRETSESSYSNDGDEPYTPREDGMHSLTMISERDEPKEDGMIKHWFLIQNSWKDLPLFEASKAYLAKHLLYGSNATPLCYVKGPKPYTMPEKLHTCHGVCFASDFDDGGDEMEPQVKEGGVSCRVNLFP